MNWIGILTTLLTVVNVFICLLLIFVVLLQRPKNEGLGAAFGGDTASNIFGAQTTNVLANITRWLGGIFLIICFIIAILGSVNPERKSISAAWVKRKEVEKQQADAQKAAEDAARAEALKNQANDLEQPSAGAVTPDSKSAPGAPSAAPPQTPPAPANDANPKPPVPPAGSDGPSPAPAPTTPAPKTDPAAPAANPPSSAESPDLNKPAQPGSTGNLPASPTPAAPPTPSPAPQ